ncbi:pyruvate kinase alpha/beta domain-containing protein, partial [Arthrobacter sp. GCM10027362]|uniref:pyruvate kinase alpha/beta domain-containing protein n=1 Tax=Arthrobacter sp. GCM10027362 TaxID=3273379 RepID=UPI00363C8087
PLKPMFAFTPLESTRNYMALIWGITPLLVDFASHTDQMTAQVDRVLYEQDLVDLDDLVVIAAGSPPGTAGSTNMVKVHRVGDLADAGSGNLRRREKVGPWPEAKKPS